MRRGKHKSWDAYTKEWTKFVLLYKRVLIGRAGRKKQCERALMLQL